jgi:hypothetical protein
MPPQHDNAETSTEHARLAIDQLPAIEPLENAGVFREESFIVDFISTKGPPQIIILCMLLALGFGSTIGVVPAVMSDRYARLHCKLTRFLVKLPRQKGMATQYLKT